MPGFEVIGDEERKAVLEVFDAGGGVLFRHGFEARRNGSFKVVQFEREFASWIGSPHAVAVTSGTAALKVALDALGIGLGDEVITQSFTFVATVEAILATGAKPVLTEIDDTFTMDPSDLARKITSSTKAVIPVHMLGGPADLDAIAAVAGRLPVIEDTAQAPGGSFGGQMLGTTGAMGTFSFDFGKTLTTGEGGMVVTGDEHLYRVARSVHDHGHDHDPNVPRGMDSRARGGFNFRMTELQGAVGLAQLQKLDQILAAQRSNWHRLRDALPSAPGATLRRIPEQGHQAFDTIVTVTPSAVDAARVARVLEGKGIGSKILPESLSWHFAGTWDHLLRRDEAFGWDASRDLLERSVAVGVPLHLPDEVVAAWAAAWAETL